MGTFLIDRFLESVPLALLFEREGDPLRFLEVIEPEADLSA